MKIEEIQKKAYQFVRKNGVFSGSRCWKVGKPESDYDYFLHSDHYDLFKFLPGINKVMEWITPYAGEEDPEILASGYFECRGRTINVIVLANNRIFLARCWATDCLKILPYKSDIYDKTTRVSLFRGLVRQYLQNIKEPENTKQDMGEDVPF